MAAHDVEVVPARYCLNDVDSVVLGRGATSASRANTELRICINDGAMSGEHAALERSPAGWRVRDLGSKNGIFLDGVRIDEAEFQPGTVLELGRTFFMVSEHIGELTDQVGSPLRDHGTATMLPSLEQHFRSALQVARSDVAIVVTGPTGTGKELITRAIHKESGRTGPCIAVNCGSLAPNLVESELFGYKRGAFSGATEDRLGLIRSAHRGTLFLDEIGELPPAAQVALLRALEQKAVVPVGGTTEIPVDFRLSSATHRDLRKAVAEGSFRADLFARISGFTIELPPLRRRREDLGLIFAAVAHRYRAYGDQISLTNDAARAMLFYDWPHNMRELTKAVETAIVLAQGNPIDIAHLPFLSAARSPSQRAEQRDEGADDEALRARLVTSLRRHRGNLAAVARDFDKDRVQIRRWLTRFGIDVAEYRDSDASD